jgi:cell wall-associated NlpC family hydrolase
MRHGQKRIITALTGTCAMFTVALVPMSPSSAAPDINDVKARVERLQTQAEQASERYNDARILRDRLEQDLADVKAEETTQRAVVSGIESAVDEAITAQYEGHALSATGEMVATQDPGAFLTQLTTLHAYNDVQSETLASYDTARQALDIRHDAVGERTAELKAVAKRLAKEKTEVEAKTAAAQKILDGLEQDEMDRYLASLDSGTVTDIPKVAASGRAAAAVRFALAQLGDPYVWGAAGPGSWDCSGLTMGAWGAAGVGLPHSSSMQSGSGTRVSISQLQPGDLVFYYSPISHVAMYIGGGKIVHAPHSGSVVQIADMNAMPITTAVRPG